MKCVFFVQFKSKTCVLIIYVYSDINECEDPRICHNGRCDNADGTFVCTCEAGYELRRDGKTCVGEHSYSIHINRTSSLLFVSPIYPICQWKKVLLEFSQGKQK